MAGGNNQSSSQRYRYLALSVSSEGRDTSIGSHTSDDNFFRLRACDLNNYCPKTEESSLRSID